MKKENGRGWELFNDDCVAVMSALPADSVDYSVSSVPFSSLFSYSDDPRDLSNCESHEQFFSHMDFVAREMFRVVKPGRLASTHVMTLPTSKSKDGHIGLYDFGGDVIRCFERAGFWFHSKVVIFKNPVVAMQRTKARGLLWKELRKNSAVSRMGLPDEVLTFRKPGENTSPITHSKTEFPVAQWQQWASPTWMFDDASEDLEFLRQCALLWSDIDQGDVLPSRAAKEEDDQRHLCPLQKEVVRRCLHLWSNPADLVLSPFAGIGSEGYVSLQEGRRFIGAELKASYWRQAVANLQAAERRPGDLFADRAPTAPAVETDDEPLSDSEAQALEESRARRRAGVAMIPHGNVLDEDYLLPDEVDAEGAALPPPAYPQFSGPSEPLPAEIQEQPKPPKAPRKKRGPKKPVPEPTSDPTTAH